MVSFPAAPQFLSYFTLSVYPLISNSCAKTFSFLICLSEWQKINVFPVLIFSSQFLHKEIPKKKEI